MRHTYQSSSGGSLVIPMERKCCIIGGTSTPRLAKMISWKYAYLPAGQVAEDLQMHHNRPTSRCFVQQLAEATSDIAREEEFEFEYALPPMPEVVKHIVASRDGTTVPLVGGGYREAMVGTISFYSAKCERMYSIYAGCAPQYGKQTFDTVMDIELLKVKALYPEVTYVGIADGAKDNWRYLENHTQLQVLDFYHACEHLSKVSVVMAPTEAGKKTWLDNARSDLKHKTKGADFILREMMAIRELNIKTEKPVPEVLNETITYFTNNRKRMQYTTCQKMNIPIGSGVTEAACKTLVKQRLNGSGMKWQIDSVENMLLLRGIILTKGRWEQFWIGITKQRA